MHEEINTLILAFQNAVIAEEQILSNWKAIQDKIKALEVKTAKK